MKQAFRLVLAIIICMGAGSNLARAENPLQGGDHLLITGEVSFEPRGTRVIQGFCEEGFVCPKPQHYWVLTINYKGYKYQLNEKINMGSDIEPNSHTVQGKTFHKGAMIQMDATVLYSSPDLTLVDDIENLVVLSDPLSTPDPQ